MRIHSGPGFVVLAFVILLPSSSFCLSDYWVPPFANVVRTDRAVVVAYEAGTSVRVQAHSVSNGRLRWSKRIAHATLARDACACNGRVYVATSKQGVYVLNSRTGSVRTRLRPPSPASGEPELACGADRLLVNYSDDNWLIAYSTRSSRRVWKRLLRDSEVSQIAARGSEFTVLVRSPSRDQWKQVVLRSDNGVLITRRPATLPAYAVPDHVPKGVRRWYYRTVGARSTLAGRTSFERRGRLWFVGVPAEVESAGTIYAVRDDGHVVWTKADKGLSSVVLAGKRAIAVAVRADEKGRRGELFALDAATGKRLWNVDLLP